MEKREHWKSKFGFILAATGGAIGLGNIWRFPYITGKNGGAAFVLIYIGCCIIVGIPLILAELSLGRRSQKDAVGTFKVIKPGSRWFWIGGMGVVAGYLILSYYSVVAGWTIGYFFESLLGTFRKLGSPQAVASYFDTFAASPLKAIGFQGVFIALCMIIVIRGIQGGIERACKLLMPTLFGILIICIIRSITLKGSLAGLTFFIKPDFSQLSTQAIFEALGQSFFTLSLGMGAVITYGSYLTKKDNLATSGVMIAFLDTLIAILAGFAIFPAIFAFGLPPDQGPGLVFRSLTNVFNAMPGGAIFGPLFFFLLIIAAVTSGISLLEVITAYFVDQKGWSRRKTVLTMGTASFLLGIPSALSFGHLQGVHILGKTPFGFVESLTANYMLPLGGLMMSVFVAYIWGGKEAIAEVKIGNPAFLTGRIWIFLLRYICPFIVAQILLFGILSEFTSPRVISFAEMLRHYLGIIDIVIAAGVIIGGAIYIISIKRAKKREQNPTPSM